MSTKTNQTSAATDATPPYIPWKTLEGYVANLKKTTVPHSVDNTVRPPSMAGGLWRQLVSALRYLRLIDQQGATREGLNNLVACHGTPKWKEAVAKHVIAPYKDLVDGLSIINATPGQLDARFKEHGKVNGQQMLQKSIRFYLHAMREAGVGYSPLLIMRRPPKVKSADKSAKSVDKRNKGGRASISGNGGKQNHLDTVTLPKGYTEFPLRDGRKIIVPTELSKGDVKTITQYLTAFVGLEDA